MSGIEPILAAEAATAGTAAASTAAAATAAELAAATAAAEGASYASAVPGLMATGPGSQAALLAAQTAEFGLPGLAATAASGAAPGTLAAGFWNAANSAMLPGGSGAMNAARMGLQGAQLLSPGGQRSAYSPAPMNKGRQVDLASPVLSLLEAQPMRRRKEPLSLI